MSLTLYYHPLSSFCWKALIALYENDTPFTPQMVDLSNEDERAALLKIWPIGKFPVLRDSAKDRIVPESQHHHRISRHALSRRHALPPRGCRCRAASSAARPVLRSLCAPADAEDHGRPDAAGREPRSVRRRGSQGADHVVLRHDRQGSWRRGPGRWARRSASPTAPPRRRCSTAAWWCRSAANIRTSRPISSASRQGPSFARVLKEAEPYFGMVPKET